MQYMLLIYENDAERIEKMDDRMPTCAAYAEAMKKAGIYVCGERLRSASATTSVRWSTARRTSWTVRMPRRRNSSAASTSSTCRTSTPRSSGRPDARAPIAARSRSAPSGPTTCNGPAGPRRSGRERVETCRRWPTRRRARPPRPSRGAATASSSRTSRRAPRDVAGAEDALAEAFASALADWPTDGVPRNPEAWLMTVARRRQIDASRRRRSRTEAADHLRLMAEEVGGRGKRAPDARRAPRADVRLRPSGDRAERARAADPADRPRLRCGRDRARPSWSRPRRWPSGWCAPRTRSARPAFPSTCPSATSCRNGWTRCSRPSTRRTPRAGRIPAAPTRGAATSPTRPSGSAGWWRRCCPTNPKRSRSWR